MKKIAIAGFGTVGGGVARLLSDKHEIITKNAGEDIQLGAILVRKIKENCEFAHLMTTDFSDIEKYLMENIKEGDIVITLGAGDINKVGKNLVK